MTALRAGSVDAVWAAAPGRVGLVALVGSHAYGTARPDSDRDYRGFYVAPTERLFELGAASVLDGTFDRQEPDVTLHELAKFVRLCVAANPTVLETLWCEPVEASAAGELLRAHRRLFLSKRLLKTYGGYALQQLRKARAGAGGSRGQRHLKRDKFFLHTYRLMFAGIHALEHGDLQVRVADPDALWDMARQPLEVVERSFARLDEQMRAAAERSPLPEAPDVDAVNVLLREIRHLERLEDPR